MRRGGARSVFAEKGLGVRVEGARRETGVCVRPESTRRRSAYLEVRTRESVALCTEERVQGVCVCGRGGDRVGEEPHGMAC